MQSGKLRFHPGLMRTHRDPIRTPALGEGVEVIDCPDGDPNT